MNYNQGGLNNMRGRESRSTEAELFAEILSELWKQKDDQNSSQQIPATSPAIH